MIKVAGLKKSFGSCVIFEDISFSLNPGERAGLVGRNGHGKTTLLRIIIGEEHQDEGEIGLPKNYTIGYVKQKLNFTRDSVIDEACLGLPEEHRDERWQAEKILFGLGFTRDDMETNPALFSGGYQVRLNLAKVLVSNPNLLLLDEPTNYLDIVAIRWLAKFLREWRNELILVTH
ncbi:MAG: ATP-binding cassette domain-containing protein, partial [Spirochaetes bacterium]|nr:ATP-binding cassette domain-containing protein [Spirochaetota bacterium]